ARRSQRAPGSGNLVFTSSVQPPQRIIRVYGTRQCLEIDCDAASSRYYRSTLLRGALAKLENPLRCMGESACQFVTNLKRFFRSELHYFAGMKRLFELFYRAIREDREPPIAYEEIHRVTAVMDTIFACCRGHSPLELFPLKAIDSPHQSPNGLVRQTPQQ